MRGLSARNDSTARRRDGRVGPALAAADHVVLTTFTAAGEEPIPEVSSKARVGHPEGSPIVEVAPPRSRTSCGDRPVREARDLVIVAGRGINGGVADV